LTTLQTGRIFISYRRADSAGYAGRIYDRLTAHFGEDAVFMDVDTIEAGLDFVEVLQNAVQSCDVLVALIGRRWLDSKDAEGKRRLDNPEDFVRVEIAAALERDIRVIPVLVDGVPMPLSIELPSILKSLTRRNALQVNHPSFNADAQRLISQLELALEAVEESKILKAQSLKKERARAQRQVEIKRLLKAGDLAIDLKDWELAREKLTDVLRLDANHLDARSKLDIVRRKIFELEQEKAHLGKEARENVEAKERTRFAAAQEVEKEREEREPFTPPVSWPVNPAYSSEPGKPARKPAWLPIGIGGGVILVCAIIFGIGYLILNTFTPDNPTVTERQPTKTSSASTPTDTAVPKVISTNASEEFGVGSTMVSEKDGMVMVYVPAGEFLMGSETGDEDEKPVHTVYLDSFWIDQTEVTNAMYARCVEAGACEQPSSINSDTHNNYYENPDFDDYPVNYVYWDDAVVYCEWANRRLPTEAEWEKAASWDESQQAQRVYPWGDTIDDSFANYNKNIGDTTAVGSYEKGASFYGALDMAGNVWEWVSDRYGSDYYANSPSSNPTGPDSGSYRVLRGGSWLYRDELLRSANRNWVGPALTFDGHGFRCSRSP